MDKAWTAELTIPWSDFRKTGGRPHAKDSWRFNVGRYDYPALDAEPMITSSSKLSKPSFHAYEDYGTLVFEGLEACD